jgi:hypothetical protein
VLLVLDRVGTDATTGELARPLSTDDTSIPVDDARFAPAIDPVSRYVKIDEEWIRWSSRDGSSFAVDRRGDRGTRPTAHEAGARVRAGAVLIREFDVPAFREDWND